MKENRHEINEGREGEKVEGKRIEECGEQFEGDGMEMGRDKIEREVRSENVEIETVRQVKYQRDETEEEKTNKRERRKREKEKIVIFISQSHTLTIK